MYFINLNFIKYVINYYGIRNIKIGSEDMKKNIMLSVVIISYNQERYIREAIESVINQKTNYEYEILLADDCSPDNTGKIMKEYAERYPELIRLLERPQNLGGAKNYLDACLKAKGKYITILEGDDYWCDENKIQSQVEFLEENPEYYATSHLQEGRNLDNEVKGYFPKNIRKNTTIFGVDDFIQNDKLFSSSATLFRNFFQDEEKLEKYKILNKLDDLIGDAQMNIFLCSLGKIYVEAKPMMVYRMRNNDGNSNFNSSHSINEIQYRYMNIYIKIEKIYDGKYSLYKKIKYCYTLGVAYDLCKFKFDDIKKFNLICPNKYKWKIILLFPFTSISILSIRFIKR